MTGTDGYQSINRTTFSGCRQYAGESTISFEDPGKTTESTKDPERVLNLPAGLSLRVELDTPIIEGKSAVGDPVTAILKKDLKLGTGLVAPKGAFMHGRIIALRRQDIQQPGWVVGFDFSEMEWENTRANFSAELIAIPTSVRGFRVEHPSCGNCPSGSRDGFIFRAGTTAIRPPRVSDGMAYAANGMQRTNGDSIRTRERPAAVRRCLPVRAEVRFAAWYSATPTTIRCIRKTASGGTTSPSGRTGAMASSPA